MNILKVVKEEQDIVGAVITDGSEVYPIKVEGLHNPIIFDGLLQDGWKLSKYPYGFVKDGLRLEDIPSTTWAQLNLSDGEKQEMEDINADVYPPEVVKTHIDSASAETLTYLPSMNFITTRAELLDFLKEAKLHRFGTPVDYLPLNSFVATSALFTPEEFFKSENAEYRSIIENRRIVNLADMPALIEFLKKHDLPDNYNPIELVHTYFSWGICGLRFDVYDQRMTRSPYRVSASLTDKSDMQADPFITLTVPTYIEANGNVYRPEACKTAEWKTYSNAKVIEHKAAMLRTYGEDYICPERLMGRVSDVNWEIDGSGVTVVYDDSHIRITTRKYNKEYNRTTPALAISKTSGTGIYASKFLCMGDKLHREVVLCELSKDLLRRSLKRSSASSYDAVTTLGTNEEGVAHFMFSREEFVTSILSELPGKEQMVAPPTVGDLMTAVEKFLAGTLSQDSPLYNVVSEIWEEIVSGSLNIDSVAAGQNRDWQRNGEEEFKVYLRLAMDVLGLSYDELRNYILTVEESTPFLELAGNGKRLRIDLPSVSAQDEGYKLDTDDYRIQQATQAKAFGYVISAWRELGGVGNQKRHVGLEMDLLDLSGKKAAKIAEVNSYLTGLFVNAIENEVNYADQRIYMEKVPLLVANQYFAILYKNQIIFPQQLGGAVITPPEWVRSKIADMVERVVDTTYNLSEITVSPSGGLIFYCVNAIVLPDYVVPRPGFNIREVSMVPMWFNTVGYDDLRNTWISRGYFSDPEFYGYEQYYNTGHLPRGGISIDGEDYDFYNVRVDPYSLRNYFLNAMEFLKNFPQDKELVPPPHPADKNYRNYELDADSLSERVTGTGNHSWVLGEVATLTRDSVISREERLEKIWSAEKKASRAPDQVKIFSGFTAEDLMYVTSLEDIIRVLSFDSNKIAASRIAGTDAISFGGSIVNCNKIAEMYESGAFQINRINGNTYLVGCENIDTILEVRV